jgi:hypothetical protein
MSNRTRPIDLSESDREELERLARSPSTAAGLSRRARAVLLMADHVVGTEIARLTDYTPVQISRIRRRFAEEGLNGLADKPRLGRPPRLTEAKRARIVALTLKPPPAGLTHWSTREIAMREGVSHSTVHRIWRAHVLQPHRVETFKFTTDPTAEEKIHDVVGLYLNPPTNAVVLSLDEKTHRAHPAHAPAEAESPRPSDARLPASWPDQPLRRARNRVREGRRGVFAASHGVGIPSLSEGPASAISRSRAARDPR